MGEFTSRREKYCRSFGAQAIEIRAKTGQEKGEGGSGNSGRPEKQRASVVAGGGALRTLDWDTSAINLSV